MAGLNWDDDDEIVPLDQLKITITASRRSVEQAMEMPLDDTEWEMVKDLFLETSGADVLVSAIARHCARVVSLARELKKTL